MRAFDVFPEGGFRITGKNPLADEYDKLDIQGLPPKELPGLSVQTTPDREFDRPTYSYELVGIDKAGQDIYETRQDPGYGADGTPANAFGCESGFWSSERACAAESSKGTLEIIGYAATPTHEWVENSLEKNWKPGVEFLMVTGGKPVDPEFYHLENGTGLEDCSNPDPDPRVHDMTPAQVGEYLARGKAERVDRFTSILWWIRCQGTVKNLSKGYWAFRAEVDRIYKARAKGGHAGLNAEQSGKLTTPQIRVLFAVFKYKHTLLNSRI